MRAGIKKIVRMVAAVVVGLALLDLFCAWYYNPANYIQDAAWATDVVRESGAFTSRANEGFSSWIIDENGYVNREVPGEDGVFALMMGSSHVEGLYVQPGDDITSQLNDQLRAAGLDGFAYNIGISNHDMTRNIRNLDRALTRFAPTGYVLIETNTVASSYSRVYGTLDGTLPRNGATEVVVSALISERPLVRTVARQLLNLREHAAQGDENADASGMVEIPREWLELYEEAMTELFQMVRGAAEAHGVKPIIYYHPTLLLQEDGSVAPDTIPECLEIFRLCCERTGVRFVDMTDIFLQAYETEHILPHGFYNTSPEYGHLNAEGNRLIAEVLCAEILELEAQK